MKLKKENGVSLAGFVITILVIMLVIVVAGCVYLFNNPIKEEIKTQNSIIIQNDEKDNDNSINNIDLFEEGTLKSDYRSLKNSALLKISSEELTQKKEIYEYDFNNDGIKEKITIKEIEEEYIYSIYYEEQELFDSLYNFSIYVVDWNEEDEYFDLIISDICDGGGDTTYQIYKNYGTKLEELKYSSEKAITGDEKGENLYLNGKNNFILISDVESCLNDFAINTYYIIEDNSVYNVKVESPKFEKEYIVKKEISFTEEYPDAWIEGKNGKQLKVGTKLQIIGWIDGPNNTPEIIKVKLDSGEIGYIFYLYA